MAETKSNVTRRSFLGSLAATAGAAGAVSALPMFPALAQQPGPGRWTDSAGFHLAALRAAYQAEIARLAATLRPRFESGELRAFRENDDEQVFRGTGDKDSPQWEVERICGRHFRLEVTTTDNRDGSETLEGDESAAHLVLAASPHAGATGDGATHPCHHATEAASWDVIAYARTARWYTPAPDECEDPVISKAECPHCGHWAFQHEDDGRGCGDGCGCKARHTPHVPGFVA